MGRDDVIMVECPNCQHGIRWIPREVEEYIKLLEHKLAERDKE